MIDDCLLSLQKTLFWIITFSSHAHAWTLRTNYITPATSQNYIWHPITKKTFDPIAEQSNTWFCGHSPADIGVRIPPGQWCCVLQGWGLCNELVTRPESYQACYIVFCDLLTPRIRRSWLLLGYTPTWKIKSLTICTVLITDILLGTKSRSRFDDFIFHRKIILPTS
jgi:hypothetical protein